MNSEAPLRYTFKEAAALLACSTDTIAREAARGKLIVVGRHTGRRIDAASLHAYHENAIRLATPGNKAGQGMSLAQKES